MASSDFSYGYPKPALENTDQGQTATLFLFAVQLQCFGFAGIAFREALLADVTVFAWKSAPAILALFLAASTWFVPLRRPALFTIALLFAAVPLSKAWFGQSPMDALSPVSSAARFGLPLAAALGIHERLFSPDRRMLGFVSGLLTISIALTFTGHGIKALAAAPHFVALIHYSALNVFAWSPDAALMALALSAIGAIDLVVSLTVVAIWFRPVGERRERIMKAALVYMIVWGALTAVSRASAFGWSHLPDVLFRSAHFVVPWVLLHLRAEATASRWSGRRSPRPD